MENTRTDLQEAAMDSLSQERLHSSLLKWFERSGRSFPWRDTSDPFKVLVAEKLLQKTAARTHVVRIYEDLVQLYPGPEDLAHAILANLEKLLHPLGLVRRPRELIKLSGQLVSRHGGKVPEDLRSLKELEGVGEYIGRAVLCFGFGQDIAIVDTNIARWLYRLLGIKNALPSNPARKRELLILAQTITPPGNAKRYHWAVLDLCAEICLPKEPRCPNCPARPFCSYGHNAASN